MIVGVVNDSDDLFVVGDVSSGCGVTSEHGHGIGIPMLTTNMLSCYQFIFEWVFFLAYNDLFTALYVTKVSITC